VKAAGESELKTLIEAVARGDERAFAAFYDAVSDRVHGLACFLLKDDALAEEVTLDTFLQVWREAGHYRAEQGGPLAWLMMIARSRAIDRLRAQRASPLIFDGESHDDELVDRQKRPDEALVTDEQSRRVRVSFSRLAPIQRQVLAMAFFRGMTHSEIALHCGLPLGTVKTHIRQGMTRLGELLAEHAEIEPGDGR